ncbi:polysaccharide deacetylase family protein [Bacteroides oleiciplenus]|uniref:polysaccharide deacetylase family protein n=1 Tax=Bacteroides oleiciplenus TaxID=626931 RepID=UPI0026DB0767|nr:polysaccharide deacetylase family protein [Bacteroides oleiciplenus]
MNFSKLKYLFSICLFATSILQAWGQSAPTLAVRIDDLGAFHSVNEACIQTYQSGIARSVEVMPVASWYPEAVRLLKENPGLDAGLHLVITSEWENVKWRPLTHCPSLTDENGYFYPMMGPNPAYPGQSVMENKWDLKEVEQEFRAQIEMALKNIPQLSHLTGHMLSTGFTKEVNEMVLRLAKEYHLPSIDRMNSPEDYQFTYIGYDGPNRTSVEKEESFIRSLNKLEAGKRYLFLDHPALDNEEMRPVFHIGYENVALDRQGVTDLLTSPRVKQAIEDKGIKLISINQLTKGLPHATTPGKLAKAMQKYLDAMQKANQELHSIMIVQHGKVIAEEWFGGQDTESTNYIWVDSATISKANEEKLMDFLYPRLFRPLGIVNVKCQKSPQSINSSGWRLFFKTEDFAKLGQLFLQKGKWNGQQMLPEEWIAKASACCADGRNGQYILVIPEKDAVIAVTTRTEDGQTKPYLIRKHLLPAL